MKPLPGAALALLLTGQARAPGARCRSMTHRTKSGSAPGSHRGRK